jgi:hypothetical protein
MSGERIGMALCALTGAVGLGLFGSHVWSASVLQSEPSGITVRCENSTIYAPKALIDFARAHRQIGTKR